MAVSPMGAVLAFAEADEAIVHATFGERTYPTRPTKKLPATDTHSQTQRSLPALAQVSR
jgi:hypothetical protein